MVLDESRTRMAASSIVNGVAAAPSGARLGSPMQPSSLRPRRGLTFIHPRCPRRCLHCGSPHRRSGRRLGSRRTVAARYRDGVVARPLSIGMCVPLTRGDTSTM